MTAGNEEKEGVRPVDETSNDPGTEARAAASTESSKDGGAQGASLQGACLRLQRFWTDEGCLLLPGHDQPLVAGILHPRVLLSIFGHQPRSFVYLQPVRRPLDGRHGNQPYRLARHLQLVTLLRPAPDDLLRRFLASLRSLGITLEHHDVRFTEGRWSLPGVAGWGLGWNVNLDGVGVARVTVIQSIAGHRPEPLAAEIAYGVERLLTCVTGARSAYDIAWAPGGPRYGELRHAEEQALSRHAFEVSDPARLRARLALDEADAEASLAAGLPSSACTAATRGLYLLDLLAARRELGAAERAQAESRIAAIVSSVAERVRQDRPAGTDSAAGPVEPPKGDPLAGSDSASLAADSAGKEGDEVRRD